MWLYLTFHQLTLSKQNNLELHKPLYLILYWQRKEKQWLPLDHRDSSITAAPKSDALCTLTSSFLLLLTEVLTLKSCLPFSPLHIAIYNSIKIMLLEILHRDIFHSTNTYVLISFVLGTDGMIVSKINMAISFLGLIIWWRRGKLTKHVK